MKAKTYIALIAIVTFITSCTSMRKTTDLAPIPQTINLALVKQPQADRFANLEYGIRLNVQDGRSDKRLIQLYDAAATNKPTIYTNPEINSFVPESMRRYMRTMGFNMDADVATDYLMQITIKEFHVDWLSGLGWNGTVIMDVKIFNHNRDIVYPTTEVSGRANVYSNAQSVSSAQDAINEAYANALADIDWDRVAYFLHRADNPKQEANKKVTGEGDTALEHLTIHYRITSDPEGAGIYFQLISGDPEVKVQAGEYLETTPITDIIRPINAKGLTYNKAGNVSLQIRCEKKGYNPQIKEIPMLNLIESNYNISLKFNLVKKDE